MMFDPTIFENLKVGIENYLYDLDNLDQEIVITNRSEHLELAKLSRSFAIQFKLVQAATISAEVLLMADLENLAMEILEDENGKPGCDLHIRFNIPISDESDCLKIDSTLRKVWKRSLSIQQMISFQYPKNEHNLTSNVHITFDRKIDEEQMNDIPQLVDTIILSLQHLESY
ncbi:hypothetical protein [Alkalihalobacillus trypoxylicola]|uniref:Group-specific protein n=1 Tax=Alkalihalobacillus trypoxylicola TaxID=519424 RepID=A0A161P628_9BACI|nr:hypothetical protein [Alkalihalobacillus trypoxylicola]KYG27587.1 hypothetical protein AZF04_10350 [Alkalihalobacillus trypoxylicola]